MLRLVLLGPLFILTHFRPFYHPYALSSFVFLFLLAGLPSPRVGCVRNVIQLEVFRPSFHQAFSALFAPLRIFDPFLLSTIFFVAPPSHFFAISSRLAPLLLLPLSSSLLSSVLYAAPSRTNIAFQSPYHSRRRVAEVEGPLRRQRECHRYANSRDTAT